MQKNGSLSFAEEGIVQRKDPVNGVNQAHKD
jgi:hypothetical protein